MRKTNKTFFSIAFIDLLLNSLVGFVVLFILAFIQMNPVQQQDSNKTADIPGEYLITASWNDELNDDVDLYVMDPLGNIVYFKNLQAGLMNLERDDLGLVNDRVRGLNDEVLQIKKNQEHVIIRGIVAGEYTVNVHMYTKRSEKPIAVSVSLIRLKRRDNTHVERTVVLEYIGDEKTAFRFVLDEDGVLKSTNHLQRKMARPHAR